MSNPRTLRASRAQFSCTIIPCTVRHYTAEYINLLQNMEAIPIAVQLRRRKHKNHQQQTSNQLISIEEQIRALENDIKNDFSNDNNKDGDNIVVMSSSLCGSYSTYTY